jgi:hypothetical protein
MQCRSIERFPTQQSHFLQKKMYDVVTTPRAPNPALLFKGPPGPTLARWKVHRSWRKREKEVVQEWNRFPWRGERQGQKAINLYHSNSVMVDADMARVPIGPRMANPPSGLYPIVRGFDEGPGPHPWFRGAFREDVARVGNREGIMDYQSRHVTPDNLVQGPDNVKDERIKDERIKSERGGGSRRSSVKSGSTDRKNAEDIARWTRDIANFANYETGPESTGNRFEAPIGSDLPPPNPNPPVDPIVSGASEHADPSPPGGASRRRASVMSVDETPGGGWQAREAAERLAAVATPSVENRVAVRGRRRGSAGSAMDVDDVPGGGWQRWNAGNLPSAAERAHALSTLLQSGAPPSPHGPGRAARTFGGRYSNRQGLHPYTFTRSKTRANGVPLSGITELS